MEKVKKPHDYKVRYSLTDNMRYYWRKMPDYLPYGLMFAFLFLAIVIASKNSGDLTPGVQTKAGQDIYEVSIRAKVGENVLNCETQATSEAFKKSTPYTVKSTNPIAANITAPQTCNGFTFDRWSTGSAVPAITIIDYEPNNQTIIYTANYR